MADVFVYDGTWEGMLSAVFDAFATHSCRAELIRDDDPRPMFGGEIHEVVTSDSSWQRVWRGLRSRMEPQALSVLTTAFLSDDRATDMPVFRYMIKIFTRQKGAERDFSDPDMLEVLRAARRVRGEAHRLLQFVRFQKASDGTYFAMVEPLYNVLPMAVGHFRDRFADQPFVIYDRRRDYGYYYDGKGEARTITMPADLYHIRTGRLADDVMDPDERLSQRMWRTYFKAIAIRERINPRKQRQD
ncbi:MAG: TIGR03915 family putative DNA repair protein, partial [Muribaculaceae bacterium]|nr:TIGR03915 family putative DNA repair protein [Muribaculaceae bacterium]